MASREVDRIDLTDVDAFRVRRMPGRYGVSHDVVDVRRNGTWYVGSVEIPLDDLLFELREKGIEEIKDDLPPNVEYQRDQNEDDTVMISHNSMCYGDYGGSGSVGAGNVRWVMENVEGSQAQFGPYSFEQAWIPDTEANRELLRGLNDYPCFDDESISSVESDWEAEAWNGYLKRDLEKECPEIMQVWMEGEAEDEVGSRLWECYSRAMDDTNTYPTPEYNSVHVDIKRIQESFTAEVAALMLRDHEWLLMNLEEIGCPVRETDAASLSVALDWAQDHNKDDDEFFAFLGEYL